MGTKRAAKKAAPKMIERPTTSDQRAVAGLVDKFYQLREQRYALQRRAAAIEEQEKGLRAALIEALPKAGATGIAGKIARAQLKTKRIVRVSDYEKLYEHIRKERAFDLLQRRLNESAVNERWEAGKTVPGLVPDTVTTIELHKV